MLKSVATSITHQLEMKGSQVVLCGPKSQLEAPRFRMARLFPNERIQHASSSGERREQRRVRIICRKEIEIRHKGRGEGGRAGFRCVICREYRVNHKAANVYRFLNPLKMACSLSAFGAFELQQGGEEFWLRFRLLTTNQHQRKEARNLDDIAQ